jgi:polar amino acid transport system substrate-binding protein
MDDGTFEDICDHYFGDGTPVGVKSATQDDTKDQLLVATNAEFAPFEYKEGDTYYGIDMEIADLLAKELNKELVIVNMDFDAVCLSVGQQKADIAMAGLTINEERKEYVEFSTSYYNASQKIVVKSDNTEFDACKDAAAVEAILNKKDDSCKIGVQNGTTGQFYCEGDEDWGFDGFAVTTKGYKNGSLAIQDMLNGNIDYVIIDSAPAAAITEAINDMR